MHEVKEELTDSGKFFETVPLDEQPEAHNDFNKLVRERLDNPLVYEDSDPRWTVQTVGHSYNEIRRLVVQSTNASRPSNDEVVAAVKVAGGVPRLELLIVGNYELVHI
eukprot:gene2084-2781_t